MTAQATRPLERLPRVIAQQTRHKRMTVLRRYIRTRLLFRENAAARVGL
jgi:hypothetical protein